MGQFDVHRNKGALGESIPCVVRWNVGSGIADAAQEEFYFRHQLILGFDCFDMR